MFSEEPCTHICTGLSSYFCSLFIAWAFGDTCSMMFYYRCPQFDILNAKSIGEGTYGP